MGFLAVGEPYGWSDSREEGIITYIREHGIDQFLAMWDRVKGIDADELKWGDEIEYGIFTLDPARGTVRCSLRGAQILEELRRREAQAKVEGINSPAGGCQ